MDDTLIKMGLRIKNRRLELGMTQEDLSKRIGYQEKSSIGKIENGTVDLPLSKIKLFADVLGVSPTYLLGVGEAHSVQLDRVLMYASKLVALDDQNRAVVEGMIDALSKKG